MCFHLFFSLICALFFWSNNVENIQKMATKRKSYLFKKYWLDQLLKKQYSLQSFSSPDVLSSLFKIGSTSQTPRSTSMTAKTQPTQQSPKTPPASQSFRRQSERLRAKNGHQCFSSVQSLTFLKLSIVYSTRSWFFSIKHFTTLIIWSTSKK